MLISLSPYLAHLLIISLSPATLTCAAHHSGSSLSLFSVSVRVYGCKVTWDTREKTPIPGEGRTLFRTEEEEEEGCAEVVLVPAGEGVALRISNELCMPVVPGGAQNRTTGVHTYYYVLPHTWSWGDGSHAAV